jgi:hypothetical protein
LTALLAPSAHGQTRRLPLAVLGDSDSHSYGDDLLLVHDGKRRGGSYREFTFQWTELLARIHPREVDLGKWDGWGQPYKVAEVLDFLGLRGRAPRKRDYEYNFAIAGAECTDLNDGPARQAPRLARLIAREARHWEDGVVIIQMGVNDLGQKAHLDAYATGADARLSESRIDRCVMAHRDAIFTLRRVQPRLRILIAGIFDNSALPRWHAEWTTPLAQQRIRIMLDRFDDGLRAIARDDPRVAFFDVRRWFAAIVGTRDAAGHAAYRAVRIHPEWTLHPRSGDHPAHLMLADDHAGTGYNALWLAQATRVANAKFGSVLPEFDPSSAWPLVRRGLAMAPREAPRVSRYN